jgi:hypothetical protein
MKEQIEKLIEQRRDLVEEGGDSRFDCYIACLKKPIGSKLKETAVTIISFSSCEQYVTLFTDNYKKKIKATKFFDYVKEEF